MQSDTPYRHHTCYGFAQLEMIGDVPLWRPYVDAPSNAGLYIPSPRVFNNPESALREVREVGSRIHHKEN